MRRIIIEINDPNGLFGQTEDSLHSFWGQMFALRYSYRDIIVEIYE